MNTIEETLERLIEPIIWYVNDLPWPRDDWSRLEMHPQVQTVPLLAPPPMRWRWPLHDIAVRGLAKKPGGTIWFWGEPLGQEKQALLDAMLIASRGRSALSPANKERMSSFHEPRDLAILTVPG